MPFRNVIFDIRINLTNSQFVHDNVLVIKCVQVFFMVNKIIITGIHPNEREQALELKQGIPDYYWSTVGVHLHDASSWSPTVAEPISQLA